MTLIMLIAMVLSVIPAQGPTPRHEWRGIVPLHSTRADVERLFGAENNSGRVSVYRTNAETLRIEYLISPCKGSLPGWNVPPDTVLQIEVVSREQISFSDLEIDRRKYERKDSPAGRVSYINLEEGVMYEVLPDGVVYSVTYLPSIKDVRLRCPGYPAYDGNATNYHPYDAYGERPFSTEAARLDMYAAALMNDPTAKGYIIVYAGRFTPAREVRDRGARARDYLINKRGIEKQRVLVLDGGSREETETELYIVPNNMPPPSPTPTVIPNKGNHQGRQY